MVARFFRLTHKGARRGPGRRYYRLVSYPQDVRTMPDNAAARQYAEAKKYAAIFFPGTGHENGSWLTLNDKARQCIEWYNAGREGYVNVL